MRHDVPSSNPSGQAAPSTEVTKVEDATTKALAAKNQKTPGQPRYPARPGYGTQGRPVKLYANYFELKSLGKELFRYHVDIGGDSAGRKPTGKKARQVVRLLLDEHFLQYQNSIATDYRSTLVSRIELPNKDTYDIRYRDEHEDEYSENPKVYKVTCQFTGKLNPSDLLDYLTSSNASTMFETKAEVIQAMNIVLGHQPKSDQSIVSVGANRHYAMHPDLAEKCSLGAGLEVLRGFFVSARAATARILVNVQVKYVACYQEGPLTNVIFDYQRGNGSNIYKLEAFLRRLRIKATHIVRKNKKGQNVPRMKVIAGLATRADGSSLPQPPKVSHHGAGPRDVQFFLEQPGQQSSSQGQGGQTQGKKGKKQPKAGPAQAGKYITVADFFRQGKYILQICNHVTIKQACLTASAYNMNLDPKMPVMNVGNRQNPSYLPVEACMVEPGQPAGAKLSGDQTRHMLNFAVRTPALNAGSVVNRGSRVLGFAEQNPTLVSFGFVTFSRTPSRESEALLQCVTDNHP